MSKSLRVALAVVLPAALALVLLGRGWLRDAATPETTPAPVRVEDLDPATAERVLAALYELEVRLATTPIQVEAGGAVFDLVPAEIGFEVDEHSTIASALEAISPAGIIESASAWGQSQQDRSWSLIAGVDDQLLTGRLDYYDSVLGKPAEGGIVVDGTTPVPRYPLPGFLIDRSTAGSLIQAALVEPSGAGPIALDVVELPPLLAPEAVDTALEVARVLLAGSVVLSRRDPDITLLLSKEQLAAALLTRLQGEPSPYLEVTFDPAVFDRYLRPLRDGFDAPPTDARLAIDEDDRITIIPGFPGALIDPDLVVEAAEQAARRPNRTSILPLTTGVAPAITEEVLGQVTGKIGEFTTEHPCCRPRVNNIQRFAATLNDHLIMPGEIMSLNDTVGERTVERGYLPAPTIIRGEIIDTVGGGVSQFATTFYNAVFWAGLEIIDHQPHTYYFSRYPEGIEATINWREPDLIFRNDTSAPVVIKTSFTGTSITVKLFGNNSGRQVSAWVSERYRWREFTTKYLPNPELMPWDGEVEVQEGRSGWSVKVTRQVDYADRPSSSQEWTVHYSPLPRHLEVHPCLLPENSEDYTGEQCPVKPDAEREDRAPDDSQDAGDQDSA